MSKKPNPQPKGRGGNGPIIFRRFIRLKNGRVLDAHAYGRKVFPIRLRTK